MFYRVEFEQYISKAAQFKPRGFARSILRHLWLSWMEVLFPENFAGNTTAGMTNKHSRKSVLGLRQGKRACFTNTASLFCRDPDFFTLNHWSHYWEPSLICIFFVINKCYEEWLNSLCAISFYLRASDCFKTKRWKAIWTHACPIKFLTDLWGYVHTKPGELLIAPTRKPHRTGLLFTHNNGDCNGVKLRRVDFRKWNVTYRIGSVPHFRVVWTGTRTVAEVNK